LELDCAARGVCADRVDVGRMAVTIPTGVKTAISVR
jgi:hypothetical protein